MTGGRWRRIVLGDVLAEHVVELRGRARVVSGRGGSGSFGSGRTAGYWGWVIMERMQCVGRYEVYISKKKDFVFTILKESERVLHTPCPRHHEIPRF